DRARASDRFSADPKHDVKKRTFPGAKAHKPAHEICNFPKTAKAAKKRRGARSAEQIGGPPKTRRQSGHGKASGRTGASLAASIPPRHFLKEMPDNFNEPVPVPDLMAKHPSPFFRNGVIFPPPAPGFFPPVGGNELALFQALQGQIKGRFLENKRPLCPPPDLLGYFISVAVLFA